MRHPLLILGLAAGYHYGDVRPFLASLDACNSTAQCVLFVTATTRDTERMAAHGAHIVTCEKPHGRAHIPYNALRYFFYRHYLHTQAPPHTRVLLTDVRDVIFQTNPAAHPWPGDLAVTLEDKRMTIGTCPYMTRWVTGHLGDDAWQALRHKPISCSGTTVGTAAAMLRYLDILCSHLEPFTPGDHMAGYDQGVHNHLLHQGLLAPCGNVAVMDNTGPILTLGYREGEPECDAHGVVLGDGPTPPVMVHQYDRKPELFRAIRQRHAQQQAKKPKPRKPYGRPVPIP